MSERYSKLFALSENLYSAGAPVVIAAGALQKDNQTGKVFAQLKIRNIQDKAIKAATVKITPFDTVGKPLGGTVDYQYLDLSARRDTDFGQKTPVMLKEAATRSFAVSVSEVIFSDNSIWTAPDEAWEPLSAPVMPEKEFTDVELAKQYRVKYGADCKCVFKKEKDLWRCACGAVNHASEKNCHSCQREAAALAALNVDELKADRDKRLAAENKRTKFKNIVFAAIIAVVILVISSFIWTSNQKKTQEENAERLEYTNSINDAIEMFETGNIEDTISAFEQLSDSDYTSFDYFKENMNEFTPLNGDDLDEIIIGSWQRLSIFIPSDSNKNYFDDDVIIFSGDGSVECRFTPGGIEDTHAVGDWNIDGNLLNFREENKYADSGYLVYSNVLRKVTDSTYIFEVHDHYIFLLTIK